MKLLLLEGSPRERGRIHGESLRPLVLRHVNVMRDDMGSVTGTDPDQYVERFLRDTDLLSAIRRWTPDLLEEVEGIAEGAGLDFESVLMLQLLDEEWWYRREMGFVGHSRPIGHCSSLGVLNKSGATALVGQNVDLPVILDGLQTLLHIREPESDVECLIFTLAGLIALNGLGNRPLGLCINALFQLDHSHDGLPVAFVIRGALAQPSLEQSVSFLRSIRHASGQNYVVGDARRVVSLECSASQVCEFVPGLGVTCVYHTNHPLVNGDQGMYERLLERLPASEKHEVHEQRMSSESRLDSLRRQLEASEEYDVETVKSVLSSHDPPEYPICQHHTAESDWLSAGCTIMALSSTPELYLAPGPPCSTEFGVYEF
jgi:isopenicillin-N N-acyltransferase-like protein